MKVSTFWGICTIILLLLIIGYYYRFSIIHNTNYEPFDVNIMNRNDGQRVFTPSTTKSVDDHRSSGDFGTYIESKAVIDVSSNYINQNVKSVDNQGHFSNTDDNLVVHSNGVHTCISPATYDSSAKSCVCPPGFAYSTVLGCLSECDFWQTFVSDGKGGGSCKDVCPDPNQYLNSEIPNNNNPWAESLQQFTSNMTLSPEKFGYNGSCSYCPYGYQTDNQNNCIPLPDCPVGTKYSDNTGNCIPYSVPVMPAANTCNYWQLDNTIASNDNANCTKLHCPSTYPDGKLNQYYDLQHGCVNCPPGYSTNSENKCEVNSECPDGFKMDLTSDTGCVSICTQSWEQWDTAAKACVNKCTGKDIHGYLNQQTVFTTVLNTGGTGTGTGTDTGTGTGDGGNTGFNSDSCSTSPSDSKNSGGIGSTAGGVVVNPGGINDINTYKCTNCPNSYISDGANGCMLGPTPSAPTCEPGYEMINDKCSLPCTDWRKYDLNTDSCLLRCPNLTNHWETNANGTGQCIACALGFKVDANNNCTVKIPIAPVLNTPVPSCAPGSYSYIDPNTDETKCKSVCPAYTVPNPLDPTVCDFKCTENQYYASGGCVSCGNGYLVDPDDNTCAKCDTNVEFLKQYSLGTKTYTEVADTNSPLGYTCNPTCDVGYMIDNYGDDTNKTSKNTCFLCDTKSYTSLFIQNYAKLNNTGPCIANCMSPNALNSADNTCSLCIVNYSNKSDNPTNPNSVGVSEGRCVPNNCSTGFIVGSDYKCSACASGYTNNTAGCSTLSAGVASSSTPVPGKCFPASCPAGTALSSDYTCSSCPKGQVGSASAGTCTVPSSNITINSITNVVPANAVPTIDDSTLVASEPSFTCTIALSITSTDGVFVDICDSNNKSLGAITPLSSSATTVTLSSVVVTAAGIPLNINYYSSKDKSNLLFSEKYTLGYTTSTSPSLYQNKSTTEQPNSDAPDYIESTNDLEPFNLTLTPPLDFAIGYIIVGGGHGGSSSDGGGGGGCWQDANKGVCPVGTIVSVNNSSKCCKMSDFDAIKQTCCGARL